MFLCIFPHFSLATGCYYSFGRTSNKSFGDPNKKYISVSENIFVPIRGKVLDVDLCLNIEHTSICDLQIILQSPSGTAICVNSYDLNTFKPHLANFYWTTFDSDSPRSIDSGKPPFTGLFRPNGESLSSFFAEQSYGNWQVRIVDCIYADTGTFKGVRLDFHLNPEIAFVPEPSSILLLGFPAIIPILRRKQKTPF